MKGDIILVAIIILGIISLIGIALDIIFFWFIIAGLGFVVLILDSFLFRIFIGCHMAYNLFVLGKLKR